jgi:hypothetical protein
MKSWILAALATLSISSCVAFGFPYEMFSLIEVGNRKTS